MENNDENEIEKVEISDESRFKRLVKTHWKVFLLFIAGIVGAVIGGFIVLYWALQNNWVGGYGTWDIGQFTIGNLLGLFFLVIFSELLFVGLPFIAYEGIIFYFWWTNLPQDEKDWMKRDEKKKRTGAKGGGAFSFIINLIFLLIVFVQGNWETPINSLPYLYWLNTYLLAFLWIIMIAGIPGVIVAIWYFTKKVD